MLNELYEAFTDPLAGPFLMGWMLVIVGLFSATGLVILFGAVEIVYSLVLAGVLAYVE